MTKTQFKRAIETILKDNPKSQVVPDYNNLSNLLFDFIIEECQLAPNEGWDEETFTVKPSEVAKSLEEFKINDRDLYEMFGNKLVLAILGIKNG